MERPFRPAAAAGKSAPEPKRRSLPDRTPTGAGQAGQVAFIQMGNPGRLEKLMAMGVFPGGSIKLLRASPTFVFESGYSQFAVDEVIAAGIYVRRDMVSS